LLLLAIVLWQWAFNLGRDYLTVTGAMPVTFSFAQNK